ncbi:propanediol utilization protein [Roseivivax sp. GX 12232]|uniref:propanediol utilization protein n=1 Tax=Roseivivax sp. GX 12232 TaxID=2900547 RepID=UPI001E39A82D|nr:propanediol utilization protein [Roseivivax sp. GX 12232]MCE0504783.1 propanediol utilization protein [Roseivivax sp. GX 12232]
MIRVAGHFGEWLQGRLGPEGPVVLVTCACARLGVSATRRGPGPLRLDGPLEPGPARALLTALDLPEGHFEIRAEMPLGAGAGASTAALVALARAAGFAGTPEMLAAACLAAEGASDPLMRATPDGCLWASREARALHPLPPPPEAEILGGFFGAPSRTDPEDARFPDIADLAEAWSRAPDLPEAARLASLSATRTSALRGPGGDPTEALAQELGALGHLRAHTGSARGLIFAPGTLPEEGPARLAEAGFARVFTFRTGGRA